MVFYKFKNAEHIDHLDMKKNIIWTIYISAEIKLLYNNQRNIIGKKY